MDNYINTRVWIHKYSTAHMTFGKSHVRNKQLIDRNKTSVGESLSMTLIFCSLDYEIKDDNRYKVITQTCDNLGSK